MSSAVQRRRGTTAQHSIFTGLLGELTIDTDKKAAVIHDGATAGGFPLLREDMSNVTPATGKAALGLGNVTNSSDANKPVSTAQQAALDLKAPLASPAFTGTVTLPSGTVTLAQQANMATASVVYRKTAGSGAPEVQPLATLKADLGLVGSNTGDQDLSGLVVKNAPITGTTNTKVTYDSKGLVTAGTAATTADIAASTNKNYVTDTQLTVISNTSGTNSGDQTAIPNASLATMSQKTYKGRTTASTGTPEDVPVATLKTDLALVKGDVGLGNVDNTSDVNKPVSTAASTLTNTVTSGYRTLLDCSGSHTAARVAGTYAIGGGDPIAISGTGTLYPIATIFIASADYPTINGLAPRLRIRAQLYTNDVAPTGNYTFGLYPITRPATSGAAGLAIYTMGTVVTGSTGATFTTPAADGLLNAVSADFALPADGHYVLGVVTTATVAASAHIHMTAILQIHNA